MATPVASRTAAATADEAAGLAAAIPAARKGYIEILPEMEM